ncbi:hypothetical protein [Actinokineospora sp. HUAS TT18]|uniref:hypothetical protein n=1 Tax=Actinokineospora sp. HUAS TT18 TaxID=3447451 RepID=UPI003F52802C
MSEIDQQSYFGLEQLSAEEISTLAEFVTAQAGTDATAQFNAELTAFAGRADQAARDTIKELGSPERNEHERALVASVIPHFAATHPNEGFPLWRQLLHDTSREVYESASSALTSSLGRVALDPHGLVDVIRTYFETEQNERR